MDIDSIIHTVCTRAQAEELVKKHKKFWVSNCGCRESQKDCSCSRMDVCLFFTPELGGTGTNFKEVDKEFAEEILTEAELKHLVPRLFRKNMLPQSKILGICFCCYDCCIYFQRPKKICKKGEFLEKTDREACIACGTCVDVCYFGARKIKNNELVVDRSLCYGCGLCRDVCPMHCIQMVHRAKENK